MNVHTPGEGSGPGAVSDDSAGQRVSVCAYRNSSGSGVVCDGSVGQCFRNRITAVVLVPYVTVVQDSVISYFV